MLSLTDVGATNPESCVTLRISKQVVRLREEWKWKRQIDVDSDELV